MTEAAIRMVVYDPPVGDLPYLAVAILPDGNVEAVAYDSFEEAQNHLVENVESAGKALGQDDA